jgi:hypothetical protein
LTKLQFYGIQRVTGNWIGSYLTDGKQKIEIKSTSSTQNIFSSRGTVKHGVPLGSMLWPLLFIIYLNDLPPKLNSSSILLIFVDVTGVIIYSKNLHDFCTLLSIVLSQMSKWFAANVQKTNVITFITKNLPQNSLNTGFN